MRIGRKKILHATRNDSVEKIYSSKLWKRIRKIVMKRDNYLCQQCLLDGKATEGNTVDHKVPINKNGHPYALSNLWLLCESCHAKKSVRERNDR